MQPRSSTLPTLICFVWIASLAILLQYALITAMVLIIEIGIIFSLFALVGLALKDIDPAGKEYWKEQQEMYKKIQQNLLTFLSEYETD